MNLFESQNGSLSHVGSCFVVIVDLLKSTDRPSVRSNVRSIDEKVVMKMITFFVNV